MCSEVAGIDPHRIERRFHDGSETGVRLDRRVRVVPVVLGISSAELSILATRAYSFIAAIVRCRPSTAIPAFCASSWIVAALLRKPDEKYDLGSIQSGRIAADDRGPTK